MKISVSENNHVFNPVTIKNFDHLIALATEKNFSTGVFKNNHRNLENFIEATSIGLDFDNDGTDANFTIEQAAQRFKDYKHVIMPTKSHRKDKNGQVKDRFRVILFLDGTVTDPKDFTATWHQIHKFSPEVDVSCKDASRFYYPSPSVFSRNSNGKLWPISKYVAPKKPDNVLVLPEGEFGELSRQTMAFLWKGAAPGGRNTKLFKAAKDIQEQGYSLENALAMVQEMVTRTGNWAHEELSEKDIVTIENAYKNTPRHAPRQVKEETNEFMSIEDLYTESTNVSWLVDGLLTDGGLSVISADPKVGKSTLMRQLAKTVAEGGEFLGRKVRKGRVLYLALEEQRSLLAKQFRKVGITANHDIVVKVGALDSQFPVQDLKNIVKEYEPSLVVIDTLFDLLQIQNINDYVVVKKAMKALREIPRETGCHLIAVHHNNKSSEARGMGRVSGSAAIFGGVDCMVMVSKEDKRRFINTSQRDGETFTDHEIMFSSESETYELGKAREDESNF